MATLFYNQHYYDQQYELIVHVERESTKNNTHEHPP